MTSIPRSFRNAKDSYEMILVPVGTALIGSDIGDRDAYEDEKPQILVDLPAYYLGVYPVTNQQYHEFVLATGHPPPDKPIWGRSVWDGYHFHKQMADHPVTRISLDDAGAYCRWAGLRVPTEMEWEKAARGPDGSIFPWGNTWDSSRCHNSSNPGTHGTCSVSDPRYQKGRSYWGHYQMAGNVWEWTWGQYDPEAHKKHSLASRVLPLPWTPSPGAYVSLRGGRWTIADPAGFRCADRSPCPYYPDSYDPRVGFRCARDV